MDFVSIKAVGDWELDVRVLPFTKDSDGQWADENTDIMDSAFSTPLVIYQHGVKKGAKQLEEKPLIVGDSVSGTLTKKSDGWWVRVVLNKAIKVAKDLMDAARAGKLAVSSDSISHLARLEVGGKFIQYEKNRPGRIAVWPLAGFSLWEMGGGNFKPANYSAIALPAMKAIYRDAGIQFPDVSSDTNGGGLYADEAARRARIAKALETMMKNIKDYQKL